MIADQAGGNQKFSDQEIQDYLDLYRDDIRNEFLKFPESVVNAASTNNQPQIVYADFYSRFQWWEADAVLQGPDWLVLDPERADYITGHWQFQIDVFVSGVAPGQLPPVRITGKVYDLNATAADLMEFWASCLSGAYDVTSDGTTMRRSQMIDAKLRMARQFRQRSKPRTAQMYRSDVKGG